MHPASLTRRQFLPLLALPFGVAPLRLAAQPEGTVYGARADLLALAAEIAAQHPLDAAWVEQALLGARHLPSVVRLIRPAPTGAAKNWAAYRARFVEPVRIRAGVAFWREHADALARAEAQWGVPAAIVAGVIGVETIYGRHPGNYRVLDALTTLALDFPADNGRDRSAFFRAELGEFLALCNRERLDPATTRGSYAGAMGLPQFMPSSWSRHAVDFDGDGQVDLRGSAADAIGSVANYLAVFGWRTGIATHYPVTPPTEAVDRAVLLAPDILPSFTPAEFAARGAALDEAGQGHDGRLALVELQNGEDAPSYVAGTENFYAITRYNWSSYYAMAVIELGATVQAVVDATR
ncbi:MAG TPA: lytic murein transglycosylase B [Methylibium sp.]|nr:lytic murein transglycosylase B [Methylibium sp.]